MQEVRPNPARLLHTVLDDARKAAISLTPATAARKASVTQPKEPSAAAVWAKAFDVPSKDPRLTRKLMDVVKLAQSVRTEMGARHPELIQDLGSSLAHVESSLLNTSSGSWSQSWGRVASPETMTILKFSATILDSSDSGSLVIDDVAVLASHLEQLLDGVNDRASEIPEDVRGIVNRQIRQLLKLLDADRIVSSETVAPEIEGVVGYLLNDHSIVAKLGKSKSGIAMLGALLALKLGIFPAMPPQPELPAPDPAVTVIVHNSCDPQPALGPGQPELTAGDEEPDVEQSESGEDEPVPGE